MSAIDEARLFVWGAGNHGQLGRGESHLEDRHTPTLLRLPFQVALLAAGGCHSLAVSTAGALYTWGWGGSGQLGQEKSTNLFEATRLSVEELQGKNTSSARYSPQIGSSSEMSAASSDSSTVFPFVVQLCAGWDHSIVLTNGGSIIGWGSSRYGQLAIDGLQSRIPIQVPLGQQRFKRVSCGLRHTIAIADDDSVFGWGCNKYGQLGIPICSANSATNVQARKVGHASTSSLSSSPPKRIIVHKHNETNCNIAIEIPRTHFQQACIARVACGVRHSVFASVDGRIWSCGENRYGQLGLGHTLHELEPKLLETMKIYSKNLIKSIHCGWYFTVVLYDDGSLFIWGRGDFGQIGTGERNHFNHPFQVDSRLFVGKVIAISCGSEHILALTDKKRLYAWGWNEHGQLGVGDCIDRLIPTEIVHMRGHPTSQIVCGGGHSMALLGAAL